MFVWTPLPCRGEVSQRGATDASPDRRESDTPLDGGGDRPKGRTADAYAASCLSRLLAAALERGGENSVKRERTRRVGHQQSLDLGIAESGCAKRWHKAAQQVVEAVLSLDPTVAKNDVRAGVLRD